jgi:hypothetical protein
MMHRLMAACVFLTLGCSSAFADNALFIESKTVRMGESGTVGGYLSNEVPLRSIWIPLVVRETTPGVYPTALSAEYVQGGRLSLYLTGAPFLFIYDQENGTCNNEGAGGFATMTYSGSGSPLRVEHPSPSNPDCFWFVRQKLFDPSLPPGSDGAGPSIALGFTAPMAQGSFEIDTTCREPGGHLLFWTDASEGILPAFTKGIIEVVPCDCPSQGDLDDDKSESATDLGFIIDVLFCGGLDPNDPACPATRCDLDCDGFATALDLSVMIDFIWVGGAPPCDPCDAL